MTKQAHVFIVTDNLAEVWYPDSTTPEYVLHGNMHDLIVKQEIQLIGVWQRDGVGELYGYHRGHFIHWTMFNTGFPMFIRALNNATDKFFNEPTLRHSTGLSIHNYGEHQTVSPRILKASEMEKLHMFVNNTWMVSPYIPVSVGQIISSLKEFQPKENETLGDAVCRRLGDAILDIDDLLNDRCELSYGIAQRLSAVTGMGVDWWLNKSFEYQSAVFHNDLEQQISVYKLSQRRQS